MHSPPDRHLVGIDREFSFDEGPAEMAFYLDEHKLLDAVAGSQKASYPLPRDEVARMADVAGRMAQALKVGGGRRGVLAARRAAVLRELAGRENPTVGDLMRLAESGGGG